jgi:hypothetical protein
MHAAPPPQCSPRLPSPRTRLQPRRLRVRVEARISKPRHDCDWGRARQRPRRGGGPDAVQGALAAALPWTAVCPVHAPGGTKLGLLPFAQAQQHGGSQRIPSQQTARGAHRACDPPRPAAAGLAPPCRLMTCERRPGAPHLPFHRHRGSGGDEARPHPQRHRPQGGHNALTPAAARACRTTGGGRGRGLVRAGMCLRGCE